MVQRFILKKALAHGPHDTPPRGTVLGCCERRKEKTSCFYAIREVRKRTLINDLLHGKGDCCFPSGHARHSKNPLCLPDSEDELKATAHSTASSSLHPDPLPLPLCLEEPVHIQVQDECALLLVKTSHSPCQKKAWSET